MATIQPSRFMGLTYGWDEHYLADDRGYWRGIILPNLQELGSGMVRVEVKCNAHISGAAGIAGSDGQPSTVNYSGIYDHVVARLSEISVGVLFLIDERSVALNYCAINDQPDGPDNLNPYGRALVQRAHEVAKRYSSGASIALEIGNEPNSSQTLWSSCGRNRAYEQIDPSRYSALLAATYAASKSAAPQATVVLGGLLVNHSAPYKEAPAYLHAVMQATLASAPLCDAIGLHPYGPPETIADNVAAIQAVMPRLLVWITEHGYSLCGGRETPQSQAARLDSAATAAHQAGVQRYLYFTFHDWGDGSCTDPGQKMGLCTVGPDQRVNDRRPAWETYRHLATTL